MRLGGGLRGAILTPWLPDLEVDFMIDRATVKPMPFSTVSPKYQVVIPQAIREALGLRSGEKVQVFAFRNRIEIVPVKNVRLLRGMVKGMNTELERDGDRV